MTRQEILDSIKVYASYDAVITAIKENLLESDINIDSLANTTIIAVENKINGASMQSCSGFTIAHNLLKVNPEAKIILYHVLPVKYFSETKGVCDMFNLVSTKPNVRLISVPATPKEFALVFQEEGIKADANTIKESLNEHITAGLSQIWHSIGKVSNPLQPDNELDVNAVRLGISKAKEIFPMLSDKDNSFIIQFLKEASSNRAEVAKGKTFSGIFCDIEGTLLIDSKVHNKVFEFLKQNEKEGKDISLWTDGNLSEIQLLLDANSVSYKLYAKRDFAGAIVEMAIDDMDEISFSAITKIFVEKFLPVNSI